MSTTNYILGRPDDDNPRKKLLQVQPVTGALQVDGAPIGVVPYGAGMNTAGGAATQQQQQQGNVMTKVANAVKAPAQTVLQQAAQGTPQQPSQPAGTPTFTAEQLEDIEKSPNVATLQGVKPLETQYAQKVLAPNGVTGSPITSADEQVAKLEQNGIASNGVTSNGADDDMGDGKRVQTPAAPSDAAPANDGKSEPPRDADIEEMWQWLKANDPRETEEQRKARETRERQKKMWGAISDGISALSNLYFSTKGAPIQYDPAQLMTTKAQERYDKLKKERETREQDYLNYYMKLMAEQRARNRDKAYNDYRQGNLDRLKEKDAEIIELKRQNQEIQAAKAEAEKKYKEAQAAKAEADARYRQEQQKYVGQPKAGKTTGKRSSGGTSSRGRTSGGRGSSSSRTQGRGGGNGGGGKQKFTF